jgi:hypothetical protein
MEVIAAVHSLTSGPHLQWERGRDASRCLHYAFQTRLTGGFLQVLDEYVTFSRKPWDVTYSIVAAVRTDPRDCMIGWARGIPGLLLDTREDDVMMDAAIWLAEAIAPHLVPAPRFQATRRGRIPPGFRAYCLDYGGGRLLDAGENQFIPPWNWSLSFSPVCGCPGSPHTEVPSRTGTCGFYGALAPFDATVFLDREAPHVLVCVPSGKVVLHERVWRAEHYDVAAIVLPLDAPAPDDPRIVRARNLPLRAWEIARELLACADLDTVPVA